MAKVIDWKARALAAEKRNKYLLSQKREYMKEQTLINKIELLKEEIKKARYESDGLRLKIRILEKEIESDKKVLLTMSRALQKRKDGEAKMIKDYNSLLDEYKRVLAKLLKIESEDGA